MITSSLASDTLNARDSRGIRKPRVKSLLLADTLVGMGVCGDKDGCQQKASFGHSPWIFSRLRGQ